MDYRVPCKAAPMVGQQMGANPHAFRYGETDRRLCRKMYEESEDCCAQCHAWGWQLL